jgi:hypothetical protein
MFELVAKSVAPAGLVGFAKGLYEAFGVKGYFGGV